MGDSSTSSTSSISQGSFKTTKPSHFRAKINFQNIEIVVRKLHRNTINLSMKKNLKKKQTKNTQLSEKMAARNQTKDLKCATHLLNDKFRNMTEEKKAIVRDLGFGGLMHIPPLRVDHQLLRELAKNFKLGENKLKTGYGSFHITPKKIGDALGINATGDLFPEKVDYKKLSESDKIIYRRFQGKTLKSLTDEMMEIGVGNEEERLMGITDYQEKKKKAINGCLFALMIIYFHLSKNKRNNRGERPPKPWIANWTKEQLVKRMNEEREETLASSTSSSETETTDSDTSTSESEAQEDSEDSGVKHPVKKGKKMDSKKRKQREEESDSDSESESESSDESEESSPAEKEKKKKETKTTLKETPQKKKKVVVEDSPPEEDQYFYGETYEISSDELDELLGENVQKSAAEGDNQADLRSTEGRYVSSETLTPDDSNVMVVREQTPSEALAIVPIQFFVPPSQQTTTDADSEPTPMLQIEGARETTLETPKQHQETTPKLPPAPTKIHPDAEEAAALLMMARTASYVSKTDLPMPSFSLGLTDSSQEGASTQETEREKSPEAATMLEQLDSLVQKLASSASKGKDESSQIRKETGGESSAKFETPGGTNQIPDDMKEKCYIWGTRLKEDAKGDTNEFEEICTLTGQGQYILMRTHLASLQANSDIECQVVSAICLILNQKKEKRFHAQIYCLPPDIVSMALSDHPKGEFISPKTNREFRVEAYPNFIPFIDRKKLSSHPYGYVFSRLIAYARGKPLEKGEKEKEIKAPYVKISGQKTSYDCAIYVMKWLELIEPENIKKGKYEWDNWTQEEVDHYRVEYASRILFSEINRQRDHAIRESSAIRLSKPSSVLLSPFCQINSEDIETG
ncbi:hypothetical protein Ahy_A09g046485 [Arachis hypogaea]|uniref:Ubiquitin-like protease family profile domain-containing protein n=1 Tax=Arachis hypogaea TaxID=3818 RepID=A0A445BQ05_ARAHY|nr:hypothetical protein Ahy_A09g046485 [Arachis hypogaea]